MHSYVIFNSHWLFVVTAIFKKTGITHVRPSKRILLEPLVFGEKSPLTENRRISIIMIIIYICSIT